MVEDRKIALARSYLIWEVARGCTTTTYGAVARVTGVNAQAVGLVILEPISHFEQHLGRPMLTALVVSQETGMPSDPFFELARSYRRLTCQEVRGFWEAECRKVYDFWLRGVLH